MYNMPRSRAIFLLRPAGAETRPGETLIFALPRRRRAEKPSFFSMRRATGSLRRSGPAGVSFAPGARLSAGRPAAPRKAYVIIY